jgi:alpha-aminoadipic semialdehyde synthase
MFKRKNLCVGILKEARIGERRAPLTPSDVRWLIKKGVRVEVESSPTRVFTDREYKSAGAKVLSRFQRATLLVGVKGPCAEDLYQDKIYMVFSHTMKGQSHSVPLLEACLKKNVTLIDYEKIVDLHGKRLAYFGRFAGIAGLVDSLHYAGNKLEWQGFENPFSSIQPAHRYDSLKDVKKAMSELDNEIRTKGFAKELSPFIIGITGHGRVSGGVQEMLEMLAPVEIHPKDMPGFVKHQRTMRRKIYKIIFLREEKFRSKKRKGFYFERYLNNPGEFESNLDKYLSHLNILIHTSYWDSRYPRLVTKKMVDKLSRRKPFRLSFISDISCDIEGSIELTHKTTTQANPTFTYEPKTKSVTDGYASRGISVMAIDNLPSELPGDASEEFSSLIRDYVYQIAAHGARDVTNHAAIPREIREAVITDNGRLSGKFEYLKKWLR